MTLRLPLALSLVGLLALSACDSGANRDDITGTWTTTINYTADTVLAQENYRIVADYSATYTFELLNEDGLIYGRITSSLDGTMSGREAGRAPVVYTLDPQESVSDYLFGTYDDPSLELDVPWGAYQADLWTFEKVGGRAELTGQVVHEWIFETLYTAEPGDFSFIVTGDESKKTTIRREDRAAPVLESPDTILPPNTTALITYEDSEGRAALNRIHVRKP